jgi:hypothetical protein
VQCAASGAVRRRDAGGVPLALDARPLSSAEPVPVPHDRYDWAYLLARAEHDVETVVHLHYAGGVDAELLLVPGSRRPALVRVPVPRHDELRAIRLPEDDAVEVLALTLAVALDHAATEATAA